MPSFLRRSIGLPPAIPFKSMSPDGLIAGLSSADNATRVTASALRRTLSAADMCSKSGAIKRTASVEHLPGLVPADDDGGSGAFEDVWSSIQRKTEAAPARQSADVWTSILSEKAAADDDVAKACDVTAPPYVHPLVKRSASCLSEKSLEICTESLGSETGSDVFSFSELPEDQNDAVAVAEEHAKHPEQLVEVGPTEEILEVALPRPAVSVACRVNSVVAKKAAVAGRPLPPPLPSLSTEKGANLHMRSHRQNGRLVLEAVSVPTRNCFRAERQGGRLLLTFSDLNGPTPIADDEEAEEDVEEEEDVDNDVDGEKAEELTDKKNGRVPMATIAMENVLKSRGGMINYVHYKFLCLTRNNTASGPWPNRLNKVVPMLVDEDDDCQLATPATLLIPAANTGALLNKYVYSWRNNTTATTSVLKAGEEKDRDTPTPEELVVEATTKRATGPQGALEVYNKLLPFLRGCNDDIVGQLKRQQPRRSLMLLRDTRCIATS